MPDCWEPCVEMYSVGAQFGVSCFVMRHPRALPAWSDDVENVEFRTVAVVDVAPCTRQCKRWEARSRWFA